jgi:tRNA1(Val) A37 N6-methylase TrmN6
MSNWHIREGERLDDLVRDGMRLIQRPDQFCFSVDSVLLAHFVSVRKKDKIAELGTGTGVIALLLSAFGAGDITAVEKNPVMAELAERNAEGNGRQDRIHVIQLDYRHMEGMLPRGGFTSVVVNPPFRMQGTGQMNRLPGVAQACHEMTATLNDVFQAARYLLNEGGRLTMIHRADRLADIFSEAAACGMEPKRLRCVHSREGEEAGRILAEFRVGGHRGLRLEPPLFVHEQDGSYTHEMARIYGKEPL